MRLHPRRARAERGARRDRSRVIALLHRARAHARCSCARPTRRCASGRRRRRRATGAASAYLDLRRRSSGRCVAARADAAWVGWGFVAEHPAFAELCDAPRHRLHRPDGRRDAPRSATRSPPSCSPRRPASRSRRGAAGRSTRSTRRARHAERIGFPLMIKATAGGGGRGIRRVDDAGRARATRSQRPAPRRAGAFGDATVLPGARWSRGARHVEVQIIADDHGTRLGGRRARLLHPAAPPEGRRGVAVAGARRRSRSAELRDAAARLALRRRLPQRRHRRVPLRARATRRFSFLEVNTRLQVEHPVTEATTGARPGQAPAPRRAPAAASRASRRRRRPRDRGAAQRRGPATRLRARARAASQLLRLPTGPGVRVDTGVAEGDVDPARVRLDDREDHRLRAATATEALARLRRALARDHGRRATAARPTRPSCSTCSTAPRSAPARSTPAGSTASALRGEHVPRDATPTSRCCGGDRGSRGRDRASSARSFYASAAPRPPAGRSRRSAARSSCATAARPTGSRVAQHRARRATASTVDGARVEVERRAARPARAPARRSAGDATARCRSRRAPTSSSRSTASPHRISRDDGGIVRAPRPAVVVVDRRRSRATRSRPATSLAVARGDEDGDAR